MYVSFCIRSTHLQELNFIIIENCSICAFLSFKCEIMHYFIYFGESITNFI